MLNKLGGSEFKSGTKNSSKLQFFFMTSGGTEKSLLKTIQSKEGLNQAGKVYIVAHSEFNSLPASLEALARLQMDGIPGEIIFFKSPSDKKSQARILKLIEGP